MTGPAPVPAPVPAKILAVDDEPDFEALIRQRFRQRIRARNLEFQGNRVNALSALSGDDACEEVVIPCSDLAA